MAEKLSHQFGDFPESPVHAASAPPRPSALVYVGLYFGVIVALIIGFGAWWLYTDTHISVQNTVSVTNKTGAAITDAGFDSIINERVGSIGTLSGGQTRRETITYDSNMCPSGFAFDQGGQTYFVPLETPIGVDEDSRYDITVEPGKLTAVRAKSNGATTRLVQIPTTKPIAYFR